MRYLYTLLFLAVFGFSWQAEANTTVNGPVCSLATTGWSTPQVCSTIWYNDVIDDGRVVVCGYDHSAGDEELFTMYLGRSTSAECNGAYNAGSGDGPGFILDFTTSDAGSTSTVFDNGGNGVGCNCSCPIPNDLVSEVGGSLSNWHEVSYYNLLPNIGAALPGFTIPSDGPASVTVLGQDQGSSNKVWSADGGLPILDFVGNIGGDVWVASWPVQETGHPDTSTAQFPSEFDGGAGGIDTVFAIEALSGAGTELDFSGGGAGTGWMYANFGNNNDVFYAATAAGFVLGYNPDNAHNPFITGSGATMGSDTDRAMSSGAFIASDELTGTCGVYSQCVTALAACPDWIEYNQNDPGNPAYRFPGYQLQGDEQ